MNYVKTTLLLGLLTGLFMMFGNLIGGQNGMLIGLLIAGAMNFFSYWFSDKIVLAMYGAKEADPNQYAGLYRIVRRLTEKAGMPMPKVYVIPEEQPNAFATGRSPKHAAVAATVGIMRILSEEELEGVMAHELMHVAHRDTLISTIAATFAGAISYAASIVKWGALFSGGRDDDNRGNFAVAIAMAILAPIAALLIQMAISRSREYAADEGAGELCRKPIALANALRKLQRGAQMVPMGGSPAAASLFIVNPFAGGMASWFSTHPPMEKRIEKLELQQRTIA
ncbi:MAG: zinc metalloprotease HtpX [Fibrobacter sp.]|nr:zinc metalloprotease HtpX [Fibrobacter sp.]